MKKKLDNMDFFKDKNGKWAVIQFPNFTIIAWLLLTVSLPFISDGTLRDSVRLLGSAVLFTWAYMEVTGGDSPFRRLLGGIVLASVIYGYFSWIV